MIRKHIEDGEVKLCAFKILATDEDKQLNTPATLPSHTP
jgi:hypothetical protein